MKLTLANKLGLWGKTKVRFKKWKERGSSIGCPSCPMCKVFRKDEYDEWENNCKGCLWAKRFGQCHSGKDMYNKIIENDPHSEELDVAITIALKGIEEEIQKIISECRRDKLA